MDPYHRVNILDKIRTRQKAFDKELDSGSDRADLLLITNNVEASVRDIYEFLKEDPKTRSHHRPQILEELRKERYLDDNMKTDLEKFFKIRDQYAHNMVIDDAHKEAEKLLEETTFAKLRSSEDKHWKDRKIREKIIRAYNALMPELLNQWNNVVIDEASKNKRLRS